MHALSRLDILPQRIIVFEAAQRQFAVTVYCRQHIVEIVRDAARQSAHRFQFL